LSIDCGLGWWGVVSGGEPDTNNPYWPTYLSGYDDAFAVYVVPDPPPLPKPTTEQECKKGGYKGFGFKNQGQCIAFVNRAVHNRQQQGLLKREAG
jgi:hypothetical protein